MDNQVEELLKAEQAVQDLLKELQALKTQVGGYDSAKKSLEDVRQSLNVLVETTSTLAEKTHSATTILNKIGTPEIIARTENIKLAITQLAGESKQLIMDLKKTVHTGLLISGFSLLVSIAILVTLLIR
jgi:hypothetical protein